MITLTLSENERVIHVVACDYYSKTETKSFFSIISVHLDGDLNV